MGLGDSINVNVTGMGYDRGYWIDLAEIVDQLHGISWLVVAFYEGLSLKCFV
jgi:hypothetical protein